MSRTYCTHRWIAPDTIPCEKTYSESGVKIDGCGIDNVLVRSSINVSEYFLGLSRIPHEPAARGLYHTFLSASASQNTQKVRNSDVYGFIRDGFTPLCSRHQPPNTRKLLAPRGEAQAPKRWSPATLTAARRPNTGKNERPTLHGANRRRHPTQRRAAPWSLTRVNTPTAAPLTANDRRELLPDSSPLHLLLRPASPPPIRQAR